MFKPELNGYTVSSYNEGTDEQIDYYINECDCGTGSAVFMYSHEDNELFELYIARAISRSIDPELYSLLIANDEVLIDGGGIFNADCGVELISDNDCYLVWFNHV